MARGRRPGDADTREQIAEAARLRFAELGFDRTTLRSVATDAGVDPALISHYFGSKAELFATVVDLPVDPSVVIPRIVAGDPGTAGERLAVFALDLLTDEAKRTRIVSIVRSVTSAPESAAIIRERLTAELLAPLARAIGADHPEYRGSLLMSQIVGLTLARAIVRIEPLASADPRSVAASVAPALQHYLTGPVRPPDDAGAPGSQDGSPP
ncbi:TetR family transcriptional regulator [Paraoerskovia marina]|uniref:TetR/AcrR family transcriptional regulator n=1 Tax=Paraoerskovia marina TaxID=545619 RepID=UPI0004926E35|nr:TetR family transcriptional regulator [Paraoerskovia marina]